MANITVTKTGDRIDVDFGGYYENSGQPNATPEAPLKLASYPKSRIDSIGLDDMCVHVKMHDSTEWILVDVEKPNAFVIDSVDGVAPASLDDLYTLLISLM